MTRPTPHAMNPDQITAEMRRPNMNATSSQSHPAGQSTRASTPAGARPHDRGEVTIYAAAPALSPTRYYPAAARGADARREPGMER